MPNWTTVTLVFDKKGAAKRLEKLLVDKETDICGLVMPMPAILEGTVASSPDRRGRYPNGDMSLEITPFTEKELRTLEKLGHYDWYSWQTANWGIKWGTSGHIFCKATNSVTFASPWSEPDEEVLQRLADLLGSGIEVTAEYEGGEGTSTYTIMPRKKPRSKKAA